MSRVGKMPVAVPEGVTVEIKQDQINVKGKGGALSLALSNLVKVENKDGKLSFTPIDESREANAMSGTFRQFGLARNKIREMAFSGDIPGVIKASW